MISTVKRRWNGIVDSARTETRQRTSTSVVAMRTACVTTAPATRWTSSASGTSNAAVGYTRDMRMRTLHHCILPLLHTTRLRQTLR